MRYHGWRFSKALAAWICARMLERSSVGIDDVTCPNIQGFQSPRRVEER
jgi:hypothetical protein